MNKTMTIIVTAVIALALGLAVGSGYNKGGMGGHDKGMGMRMGDMEGGMKGMRGDEMGHDRMMGRDMGMDGAMKGMMMGLDGKTGDAFDQAFLSEMIMHHQGAVAMAEAALATAKHQEIKDLAKAIIAAQNKEIADMKAWNKAWYNK